MGGEVQVVNLFLQIGDGDEGKGGLASVSEFVLEIIQI